MTDFEIEIPPLVPAMTLRDAVLFPKAMMPLRIFEARYRQMLDDVLSGNRMFALAGVRVEDAPSAEGPEVPFDVATVGVIRVSKKHEDGTSFVLLQGIERVRIRSVLHDGPYPMLKVEPMKTQVDDSSSELRQKLVFQLKRNMKLGGEVTGEMMDFLNPLEDDGFSLIWRPLPFASILFASRPCSRFRVLAKGQTCFWTIFCVKTKGLIS